MSRIASRVDVRATSYGENRAAMLDALAEIDALHARVVRGGGSGDAAKDAAAVARLRGRGKLLPRERIALLLDRGTPFLELSPLAGWGTDDPLGGGLVTGVGRINGVECVVSANDPTVKGGAQGPTSVAKGLRAMEVARVNRLPLVSLTESAGADLPKQAEIFVPGGASFKNLTRLSAAGIPTITLVFGSSTAGGAYVPGMSDYVVLQKDAARVYLGGPPLVKMAIDEDADEESLGGAEMHARVSGLADYLAADEPDALRIGREIVGHLNWRKARARAGACRPCHRRTTSTSCSASRAPTSACRSTCARSSRASSTAASSRSSSRSTAPRSSPAGRTSTATRSASSRTTASCSARRPRRARSSSSSASGTTSRSCSCRTSPASWSAPATSRAASSRTARS